jgi:hypothetical protein
MACLAYCKSGLENSPYSNLLDPVHWIEICEVFTRDACGLLGLSLDSPLEVCVSAGCLALPSLLQIKQVMQQRQCCGVWTSKDELPVSEEWLRVETIQDVIVWCQIPEFLRANRKKQRDWLAANTDDITSQSHSLFARSREKNLHVENGF